MHVSPVLEQIPLFLLFTGSSFNLFSFDELTFCFSTSPPVTSVLSLGWCSQCNCPQLLGFLLASLVHLMKERGCVPAFQQILRFTLIVSYTSLNQSQGPEGVESSDWLQLLKPQSFSKEIQDSVQAGEEMVARQPTAGPVSSLPPFLSGQ